MRSAYFFAKVYRFFGGLFFYLPNERRAFLPGSLMGGVIGILFSRILLQYFFYAVPICFSFSNSTEQTAINVSYKDLIFSINNVNTEEAEKIADKIRIACIVLTHPENHNTTAIHISTTWGKRCNYLRFVSTKDSRTLKPLVVSQPESRNYLWGKTKTALEQVYQQYHTKADWFLKADDDTYVIMENLRLLLTPLNATKAYYLGFRMNDLLSIPYMNGGAGYVMSKETLKKFTQEAMADPDKCKQGPKGVEDVELGRCLHNVNVTIVDSRDAKHRWRFLPFPPQHHLMHDIKEAWFHKYSYYPYTPGVNCCSDTPISFHYVTPKRMYTIEYLLYVAKVYGRTPRKINVTNQRPDDTITS